MISFVIPCYNSSLTIEAVVDELIRSWREGEAYEIICVNDCSSDSTAIILEKLASSYPFLKVVNLSNNVGQHNAIMAGLRFCGGDTIVVLEDDGQSPASEFKKLVDCLDEDIDLVYAKYGRKKQSGFRNMGSRIAAWMGRTMTGAPKDIEGSSYFATKRFVIDHVLAYKNPYPFVPGLMLRATKRLAEVPIDHRERSAGKSGYSLKKLVGLWMNGFTTFSVKPLRLSGIIGAIVFVAGVGLVIALPFQLGLLSMGSTLSYLAIMVTTLLSGLILLSLWMLGEYVGRSYLCLNSAPQYVVRSTLNIDVVEKEA